MRIDSVDETSIAPDGRVRFEFRLDQNLSELEVLLVDQHPTPEHLGITLQSGMWTLSMWVPEAQAEEALAWLKESDLLDQAQARARALEARRLDLDDLAEQLFPRGGATPTQGSTGFLQG